MKYDIFTTERAAADLRGIYEYIAYDLMSEQNALGQLERLERAVMSLDEMPERCPVYAREPWTSRGLRVMSVDNYLVFYLTDKAKLTVTIVRVMYGRRDIPAELEKDAGTE